MQRNILTVLIMLIHFNSFSQSVADNAEVEKVLPFHNEEVILKPSWIKQREELNITFLKSLDTDRMLHNFRITAGLPSDAKPLEG